MSTNNDESIAEKNENTSNNLVRSLNISVPAEKIEAEISKRLKEMIPKAKIPGFRPGKASLDVIKKRFGNTVRHDVINHFIRESFLEAIKKETLEPASAPKIEIISKTHLANTPLDYTATFEIYPEIKFPDFSQIELEKEIGEIKNEDVEWMLEKMRKKYASWHEITDSAITAQEGHKISIDFDINIEAEPPETITNEHLDFELGTGQMWKEFEEKLYGSKTGDELNFTLNFPESHLQKQFAGKKVNYAVRVKKLLQADVPEINDEFAKKIGILEGGVQTLRDSTKKMMEQQLNHTLEQKLNNIIMEKLYEITPIEVPKSLIENEVQKRQKEAEKNLEKYFGTKKSPELNREFFEKKARKDIALGLFLSEIIKQQKIELNQQKLSHRLQEFLERNPATKVEELYKNKFFIEQLKGSVLEEQALNYVKQNIKFTEKKVNYRDVFDKEEIETDEENEMELDIKESEE